MVVGILSLKGYLFLIFTAIKVKIHRAKRNKGLFFWIKRWFEQTLNRSIIVWYFNFLAVHFSWNLYCNQINVSCQNIFLIEVFRYPSLSMPKKREIKQCFQTSPNFLVMHISWRFYTFIHQHQSLRNFFFLLGGPEIGLNWYKNVVCTGPS